MKSMGSSQVRIVFAVFAIFMALCSSASAQQGWSLVPINPPIWKHTKKLICRSEGRVNCNAFPGSSCDLAHRPGSDKETMYCDFERRAAPADGRCSRSRTPLFRSLDRPGGKSNTFYLVGCV